MSERYSHPDDRSHPRVSESGASASNESDDAQPMCPDPAVIDHLVAVAGTRARNRLRSDAPSDTRVPASERTDRSAHPASRSSRFVWARRAQPASVLVALVVLMSLSVWSSRNETASSAPVAAEEPVQTFPAQKQTAPALPAAQASSLPSWDDADDVVRLHQRIEMVHARSASSDWMTVSAAR